MYETSVQRWDSNDCQSDSNIYCTYWSKSHVGAMLNKKSWNAIFFIKKYELIVLSKMVQENEVMPLNYVVYCVCRSYGSVFVVASVWT